MTTYTISVANAGTVLLTTVLQQNRAYLEEIFGPVLLCVKVHTTHTHIPLTLIQILAQQYTPLLS